MRMQCYRRQRRQHLLDPDSFVGNGATKGGVHATASSAAAEKPGGHAPCMLGSPVRTPFLADSPPLASGRPLKL
ncbi:hypothetical protein CHLRE_07g332084v5 [Chlamydomonas reinhardtii]|uniref:Uncharacterized protein n=1 Tax=Chlamydomonas reinhardtii TaxID=3055 RepID=A0A2K3DJX7_CHLRE|nr:uncharacterized protein CHLRE_07g332084v5 [Chlamydomonas reinhardtii]PNW80849.1 hypothetical protein CHLRE_07g332084v5 [Chlamydomonas reinhardtii]